MPVEDQDFEKLQILVEQLKIQNKELIDQNKNLSSHNLLDKQIEDINIPKHNGEVIPTTPKRNYTLDDVDFIDLDKQGLDDENWLL